MSADTRTKMVAGAADLMSRRGVNATSMREVVRHTDTPRGSIGHHFPRGKQQLIEEAIRFAGAEVSGPLEQLMADKGAIAGLRAFIGLWRRVLEASDYQAGCAVLAVSVEQYVNDASDTRDARDDTIQQQLLDMAQDVFADWLRIIGAALKREGVTPAHAKRLATLIVASVEGTVAMCRAARSSQPLEDVRHELEHLLSLTIVK